MPSLFSVSSPATVFQWWFVVYLYVLPFMLYASWAALSVMDMNERAASGRWVWCAVVLLLPVVGAAAYLLTSARSLRPSSRYAIVIAGLLVWLIPLGLGIWLAGGPLGPKALS